jgi:hypothetical protein
MSGRNGEVAVKRDGHVHAVAAPELSGPISVDVDAEHVQLPPGTHVSFQDLDEPDNTGTDDDHPAETDGGAIPTRSEIEMRGGLALGEEASAYCMAFTVLGLLVAGYTWGNGQAIVSVFVAAASVALGWFASGSFWRWRGAGE